VSVLRSEVPDDLVGGAGDQPVALLALLNAPPRLAALGHVADDGEREATAGRRSFGRDDGGEGHLDPDLLAALTQRG
jgi:hypothetical protein